MAADTNEPDGKGATGTDALAFGANELFNMAAPQERYQQMIAAGGVLCPMEGIAFVSSRAGAEQVLRHHETFSSQGTMDLGNIRPMIPLQIDPPLQKKYRKLLDPLFAPKRMDAIEQDVTDRVNHFIDQFIERGECNFTDEYAELFPSSVFLGLMGLPWEELHTFLHLRDGILRPGGNETDPVKRLAIQRATGTELYDYFGQILDERAKKPADDILSHFLSVEIDGDRLTREDILDMCVLCLSAGRD